MSLNWNLSTVKNCDTLCWKDREAHGPNKAGRYLTATTEALIWSTIIVGIPEITEKNAKDFWQRLSFYERSIGSLLKGGEEGEIVDIRMTEDDVLRHVGLSTNATKLTDKQFTDKCWKIHSGKW